MTTGVVVINVVNAFPVHQLLPAYVIILELFFKTPPNSCSEKGEKLCTTQLQAESVYACVYTY